MMNTQLFAKDRSLLWFVALFSSGVAIGIVGFTGKTAQLSLAANPVSATEHTPHEEAKARSLPVATPSPQSSAISQPNTAQPAAVQPTVQPAVQPNLSRSTPSQLDTLSLEEVQRVANRAHLLTESAQSVDDWKLVVQEWQKAIDLLRSITSHNPDYEASRLQLQDFESQLAYARNQANQPIAEVAPLAQANTSGATVLCQSPVSDGAAPVELTNVAFRAGEPGTETPITGCITNNTNQTISHISLIYKGTSTEDPSLFRTGNEEVISVEVQPGRTVGFQTQFTVSPLISNIQIQAISWMAAGNPEPQNLSTSVQLTR